MHQHILYLASASPRRHEILLQLGIPHQILSVPNPEGEDEPQLPDEAATNYVQRIAREKAIRASQWLAGTTMDANGSIAFTENPILAADTTVILDGKVLGKPDDHAHAAELLKRLSGNTHHVHTAVVLVSQGQLYEQVSVTEVSFQVLSEDEIARYCESNEPMGKAGAYGIQGRAAAFISHISGSYTGVMGLPAFETCHLLNAI